MKKALEKKSSGKSSHHRKKKGGGGFQARDEWAVKAQKAGYRARSVYKLLEIHERFELIHPDMAVMDIGCAPGSFLQAIRNIVREKPVVGVDIKKTKPFPYKNVHALQCSIFEYEKLKGMVKEIIGEEQFDLITSDIAPNTTGVKDVDQYASVELNIAICQFAGIFLKKGGNLVLKVFKGEDFYELNNEIQKRFHRMTTFKPKACRDSSSEEYIICFDKK